MWSLIRYTLFLCGLIGLTWWVVESEMDKGLIERFAPFARKIAHRAQSKVEVALQQGWERVRQTWQGSEPTPTPPKKNKNTDQEFAKKLNKLKTAAEATAKPEQAAQKTPAPGSTRLDERISNDAKRNLDALISTHYKSAR